MRVVLKREVLHFTAGTAFGLAVVFLPRPAMLIILAVLTAIMVIFELARFASPSLNRQFMVWFFFVVRRGEERKVTGATYFLIASLLTVLAFPVYIAATAILFLALGDPTATVVGVWKGKTKIGTKSFEGHLACLAVCLIISIILANTFAELSLGVAIAGVVAATVFQAVDLPVNDNVTIPVGSAIVMAIASIF